VEPLELPPGLSRQDLSGAERDFLDDCRRRQPAFREKRLATAIALLVLGLLSASYIWFVWLVFTQRVALFGSDWFFQVNGAGAVGAFPLLVFVLGWLLGQRAPRRLVRRLLAAQP
jgi:uncharacterized membrane protein